MYVPKSLMIGRCWRCGKKIFRYDDYYVCPKCGALYCTICGRKVFVKCPCDGTNLEFR